MPTETDPHWPGPEQDGWVAVEKSLGWLTFTSVFLSSAPQTNDDPIAGGLGFLAIGALVLVFTFLARCWGRKVFQEEGPWSFRAGQVQGVTALVVGLGMLVYGATAW
ncbi:hypothetical protein ABZV34_07060 [Streptomyces sp. NPDC005195]|uniref:hypothetical protein n=1 Tax=Streptomyces sp. NPDC005195 TaxID=3154561 RepID=UPI0033B0B400